MKRLWNDLSQSTIPNFAMQVTEECTPPYLKSSYEKVVIVGRRAESTKITGPKQVLKSSLACVVNRFNEKE